MRRSPVFISTLFIVACLFLASVVPASAQYQIVYSPTAPVAAGPPVMAFSPVVTAPMPHFAFRPVAPVPVTAYAPVVAPAPVVVARPVVAAQPFVAARPVVVGRPMVSRTKFYVRGQPIRNTFRWLAPGVPTVPAY